MDAKHGDPENTKGLSSEAARKQIRQQAIERKRLEKWATDRVKLWSQKLRIEDYDFRGWATGASKNCLVAGGVYEYARESAKLRGLLALVNPKRPREPWETLTVPKRAGPHTAGAIWWRPATTCWPCSFKRLDQHAAERALDGFVYCLADLADYLADNISFRELFRSKREELEKAFGGLDKLARVKCEFRYFLPVVEPVAVATRSETEYATVKETLDDKDSNEKRIILGQACSEVIAIKPNWAFTDSEIADAASKLLRSVRPTTCKPVQRKGRNRQDSSRSALDALSAMRLASYVPKTSAASAKELAAYLAGKVHGEFQPSAIGLFEIVRLGGRGKHIAESNFDALIIEARELFRREFPFREDAANAPTLAERIMMKSGGVLP